MRIFVVTISSVFIILKLTNVINLDWINILFPLCIYITIIATNRFTLWAVGKTIECTIEGKKSTFKSSKFQERLDKMRSEREKIKRR